MANRRRTKTNTNLQMLKTNQNIHRRKRQKTGPLMENEANTEKKLINSEREKRKKVQLSDNYTNNNQSNAAAIITMVKASPSNKHFLPYTHKRRLNFVGLALGRKRAMGIQYAPRIRCCYATDFVAKQHMGSNLLRQLFSDIYIYSSVARTIIPVNNKIEQRCNHRFRIQPY